MKWREYLQDYRDSDSQRPCAFIELELPALIPFLFQNIGKPTLTRYTSTKALVPLMPFSTRIS